MAFIPEAQTLLMVNAVVSRRREIVKVFAGHFVKAHRSGIESAKSIYGVKVPGLADITISSSHPADIDYWQALKGLFSARDFGERQSLFRGSGSGRDI
jgi:nickel-dependent lactate racemase